MEYLDNTGLIKYLDNTGSSYMEYLDKRKICHGSLCKEATEAEEIIERNLKCENIDNNIIKNYNSYKCKKIPQNIKNKSFNSIYYENDDCKTIQECIFCSNNNSECGQIYNNCDGKKYSSLHLCKNNLDKESNVKKCNNECDNNEECNSFETITYKNKCKLYAHGNINNIDNTNDNSNIYNINNYSVRPFEILNNIQCTLDENNNCISEDIPDNGNIPSQLNTDIYNISLDDCTKICDKNQNCYSIKYYNSKTKCNLYNIGNSTNEEEQKCEDDDGIINNHNNDDNDDNDEYGYEEMNEHNLLDICNIEDESAPIYISYLKNNIDDSVNYGEVDDNDTVDNSGNNGEVDDNGTVDNSGTENFIGGSFLKNNNNTNYCYINNKILILILILLIIYLFIDKYYLN
jgi:hypothetical protein